MISAICFQLANDAVNCRMFGSLVFSRVRVDEVFFCPLSAIKFLRVNKCCEVVAEGFEGLLQDEGKEEFVKNLCASPFNMKTHTTFSQIHLDGPFSQIHLDGPCL
jgi:hypothetical protein